MTTPTTTRLITTLRALAEECEHADEGTPELGRRVEAALGFAAGGRIATDVGTAVCLLPRSGWRLESSGLHARTRFVVIMNRIIALGFSIPLVVSAGLLRAEAHRLEESEP